MKRFVLITCLVCMPLTQTALAQTQNEHAVGAMYTKALNMIEKEGLLDTLDPKKQVRIANMHIDHGQVLITTTEETGQKTIIFDPIANKIMSPVTNGL